MKGRIKYTIILTAALMCFSSCSYAEKHNASAVKPSKETESQENLEEVSEIESTTMSDSAPITESITESTTEYQPYTWKLEPTFQTKALTPIHAGSLNESFETSPEYFHRSSAWTAGFYAIEKNGLLAIIDIEGNVLTDYSYASISVGWKGCLLETADNRYFFFDPAQRKVVSYTGDSESLIEVTNGYGHKNDEHK